jgi:hypothetical protein
MKNQKTNHGIEPTTPRFSVVSSEGSNSGYMPVNDPVLAISVNAGCAQIASDCVLFGPRHRFRDQ